jgi:phosphoribosyl 1,2-cyclic phosphodiesterase
MPTVSASSARLKLWGVRGSIPVPGPATVRYGGNTTCVELRADGEIIVLDAGTGIRSLGMALEREFGGRPITVSLLITHVHWDHIQGFPFFIPAYNDKNQVRVFGYDGADSGLREILKGQMATPFFPVKLYDLPGKIYVKKLQKMEFNIGKVRVRSKFLNHPGVCVGYRLFTSSGSLAFLPDNEPYDAFKLHSAKSHLLSPEQTQKRAEKERAGLVQFLERCDLLILDAQYTDEEYQAHVGWGHGSLSSGVALALDAEVRKLILFHHDPNHDDAMVDEMVKQARALVSKRGKTLEVVAAREGEEFSLGRE